MKNVFVRAAALFCALASLCVFCSCGGNGNAAGTATETGTPSVTTGKEATESVTEKETENNVTEQPGTAADAVTEPGERGTEADPEPAHKKVLVVYFSATGTTKRVAEMIAGIEDAEIYEIKAAREYTADDLNWHDRNSRSTKEQNDRSARPAIGGEDVSLEGYERIYVGYPIWWGEEPRIMDTFVEGHDFGSITVIPFCTSSSSGIGRSGKNLAENAKSGTWLDGRRFPGSVSEADLRTWIDGLK